MSTEEELRDAESKNRAKEAARSGRLSFRNFAETQMRREFKDDALEKCKSHIREFAECAQEQGLMVVFNCQGKKRGINDCMAIHNSDEAFKQYLASNPEEIRMRAQGLTKKG